MWSPVTSFLLNWKDLMDGSSDRWLQDCTQKVGVNASIFRGTSATSGVPQGSVQMSWFYQYSVSLHHAARHLVLEHSARELHFLGQLLAVLASCYFLGPGNLIYSYMSSSALRGVLTEKRQITVPRSLQYSPCDFQFKVMKVNGVFHS